VSASSDAPARAVRHPPPSIARVQRVVGDAAGAAIDQRRERLRVGVRVAPVAEHHRRRRAAAQRVGLRQVRHLDRQRGGERQRGGQRGEHRERLWKAGATSPR